MIWYFGERKKEQEEQAIERESAKAALALSQARAQEIDPRREQISDLVTRLRAIQAENHYALRLKSAFGQK